MSEHERWTERLSAYLDGELGPEDRAALEAHLEACTDCDATLAELRALVASAGSLPELPPERDLWPGIEDRLEPRTTGPVVGSEAEGVIPLSSRRRVVMTVPQLIAAGIALVLFSTGGVWMAVGAGAGEAARVTAAAPPGPTAGGDPAATPVTFATAYDQVIRELEAEYRNRRTELDPETIRVVERNLEIIDSAIADARRALEADPSSGFLSAHLAEAMRRKTDLLRRAATIETTEI